MEYKSSLERYRGWYRRLLAFYPKGYRERFAQSMEQTFSDLLRERGEKGMSPLSPGFALWICNETLAGIIRENIHIITMQNNLPKHIGYAALVTIGLLLIPLVGNFPWTLSDFVIAGILIFGTGILISLVVRFAKTKKSRIIVSGIVVLLFLLTWVELAVGLFGTPWAGN